MSRSGTRSGTENMDFMAALAANMQQFQQQQQQFQEQQQQFQEQQNQFAFQQQNPVQPQGQANHRSLDDFCRRHPPRFEGGFAPDTANDWIQELERIFGALLCSEEQKVAYATYMLTKEAENWWKFTERQIENEGQVINWTTFKGKFLRKYFPADMRRKKEMEFLRLQQGDMSVGEYAAEFENLAKYAPHYNEIDNEESKCAKFEDGLRMDLKVAFMHQQIIDFPTLVNKCRIYEETVKARNVAYNAANSQQSSYGPQRNLSQGQSKGRGKPYDRNNLNQESKVAPSGSQQREFQSNNNQRKAPIGNLNNNAVKLCDNCKFRHRGPDCVICFNCNQPGHIKPNCPQLNRGSGNTTKPHIQGKIFTMSGEEVEGEEDYIEPLWEN